MDIMIKSYNPQTLTVDDIELAIKHIEEKSGETLNSSISDLGKPFLVESRTKFLSKMERRSSFEKEIPLITNALTEKMVTFSGFFLTQGFNYAATPMWYITLEIEKKIPPKILTHLLDALSGVLGSYWGTISLGEAEIRFAMQGQSYYSPASKDDLPNLPHPENFDTPYIPGNLGWINYWPSPTLQRIGFKYKHRSLFHSVQDAANDGLILQITEEPLDFEIAEHLRKTVAIYNALPAIGGRDCV